MIVYTLAEITKRLSIHLQNKAKEVKISGLLSRFGLVQNTIILIINFTDIGKYNVNEQIS